MGTQTVYHSKVGNQFPGRKKKARVLIWVGETAQESFAQSKTPSRLKGSARDLRAPGRGSSLVEDTGGGPDPRTLPAPPRPAHLRGGDVDHAGGAPLLPQLPLLDLPLAFPGAGPRAAALLRGAVRFFLVAPGRGRPRDCSGGRAFLLRPPGAGSRAGQRRRTQSAVQGGGPGDSRCGRARGAVVELGGPGDPGWGQRSRRGLSDWIAAAARTRARGVLLRAHLLALRLPLLQEVRGAAAAPVAAGRHVPRGAGGGAPLAARPDSRSRLPPAREARMRGGRRAARPRLCKGSTRAGGGGAASGPRATAEQPWAPPSASPRVPSKFARLTSAVHPEIPDPGEAERGEPHPRHPPLSPVPPRWATAHRDTRAAATCVPSSPRLLSAGAGSCSRATDASIPGRGVKPPSRLEQAEKCVQRRTGPVHKSRAGDPGSPFLTSEKFRWDKARGGEEGCPGEPERSGRARPATANSPAGARGQSLAGGRERGWEGESEGRRGAGAEQGRSGAERTESLPESGRGEGVPPKPRPPRPGTRRPAYPAAASPPSRGSRGWDTSFFQRLRFWGGIGRSTPLSSLHFPASQVSHHSSF